MNMATMAQSAVTAPQNRSFLFCVLIALVFQCVSCADAFSVRLNTPKVVWSKAAPQVEFLVEPAQPELKELLLETMVDVSGNKLLSNVKIEGDGKSFKTPLQVKPSLSVGLYKFRVSSPGPNSLLSSQVLPFKVVAPVSIASMTVNNLKLVQGETMKEQVFSSGSNDALKLSVKLQNDAEKSSITAHQVFLRFTHEEEGTETYFALTADNKKVHSIALPFSTLSKKFSYKSGRHHLQLIVGDPTFEKSIVRGLGNVLLHLAAAPPPVPSPLYSKTLLHESDTTLKALPEISHVMRSEDPRPPKIVSLVFSGAVAVPFAGFLLFLVRLGPNMRKLFEGSQLVFGSGFVLSLGAVLALFAWYWIELTMFETMRILAVLAPAMLLFGHLSLKRLAATPSSPSQHKTTKQD